MDYSWNKARAIPSQVAPELGPLIVFFAANAKVDLVMATVASCSPSPSRWPCPTRWCGMCRDGDRLRRDRAGVGT